jgi:hypothetical protein
MFLREVVDLEYGLLGVEDGCNLEGRNAHQGGAGLGVDLFAGEADVGQEREFATGGMVAEADEWPFARCDGGSVIEGVLLVDFKPEFGRKLEEPVEKRLLPSYDPEGRRKWNP